MQPPTKARSEQQGKPAPYTRDHLSTLGDDEMCKILYRSSQAIDQALQQLQRDMARPSSQEETTKCLNSMFLAFSQIQTRLQEFYGRGKDLIK